MSSQSTPNDLPVLTDVLQVGEARPSESDNGLAESPLNQQIDAILERHQQQMRAEIQALLKKHAENHSN